MGWLIMATLAIIAFTKKQISEIKMDKTEGLKKLAIAALPVSKETGIPIAYIVAQAAHESAYGSSGLATRSNNLFGIKAGGSWPGAKDDWSTFEVIGGVRKKVTAYFRKYNSWEDSVRDWATLIKARYPRAFMAALAHNPQMFFSELQAGGYATDPGYAVKLSGVYDSIKEAVA